MSIERAEPGRAGAIGWGERGAALVERFNAERERWPLWLPAFLGLGIALYFALPVEPDRRLAAVALLLLAAVAAGLWLPVAAALAPARPAMAALVALVLGFNAAQWRTAEVATPMLDRAIGPVSVAGRIIDVESRGTGWRVTLDRVRIESGRLAGLPAERIPKRLRVTLRQSPTVPAVGAELTVRATLLPPPEPAAPGGYDFQRRAFFDGIGGTGFALGQPRFAPPEPASWDLWGGDWTLYFAGLRRTITERFMAALPEPTGVMAAALLIGERGAIPESVMNAFRDSGLAHLIAISGMNVWLVAAILLVVMRTGFALVPALALRYPIKKWAAVIAFLGTGGYLLLCGATVPTQRSFLMTGVVLGAILIDRTAISMRLCAWAAAALLMLAPENLHNPSFQMSFGAVAALIAAYESARGRIAAWRAGGGWGRTTAIYVASLVATSVVAILATSPYSAYHFNRIAVYGLAANMIAVPLTSAWVMPWGVLTLALMPFGLEKLGLVPMGWGIDLIIWTATTVAAWPGAVWPVPAIPDVGLALMTLGGLWLCLWQRRWRWLGLVPIMLGALSPLAAPPPDVLVAGDGRAFAVRNGDGLLTVWTERGNRFTVDTWARRNGQMAPLPWPAEPDPAAERSPSCDRLGCIYRAGGHVVAFAREPGALAEDCGLADIVVSTVPARRLCRGVPIVIDRFDLWRHGAHAIWLGAQVRTVSVRAERGERPWVLAPPGRRR
jgi:competence protein ComEC